MPAPKPNDSDTHDDMEQKADLNGDISIIFSLSGYTSYPSC